MVSGLTEFMAFETEYSAGFVTVKFPLWRCQEGPVDFLGFLKVIEL